MEIRIREYFRGEIEADAEVKGPVLYGNAVLKEERQFADVRVAAIVV